MTSSALPVFHFRRLKRLLAVALVVLLGCGQISAQQENEDPSELFLKAFTSVQQGEKLERDGKIKLAISKYRFASTLLEQITQRNPNWQPLIVQYRTRKTGEAIQRAEQRAALERPGDSTAFEAAPTPPPLPATPPPTIPAGRQPRYVPSGDGTDPLPTNEPEIPANRRLPVPAAFPAQATAPESISRSTQEVSSKLEKLQRQNEELRKTAAAAKDERDKIELELRSRELELKTQKKKAERATTEVSDLEGQLKRAQETLKEALTKSPDAAETRKQLREQIGELKKQVVEAQNQAKSSDKEKEETARKLAETTQRVEELTGERDAANQRADGARDANTRIDSLLASNSELQIKLETAEGNVRRLNAAAEQKQREAEALRGEIVSIRDQLKASKDENDRAATAITELRATLEQTTKDLTDVRLRGVTDEEMKKAMHERDLLKTLMISQLKEQAKREQSVKLLTAELDRLEPRSKALSARVAELGRPTIELTDEVRAMFRDTEIRSTAARGTVLEGAIDIIRQPDRRDDPNAADASGTAQSSPPTGPQVETSVNPRVPDELLPLAREMKDHLDAGRFAEAEKMCERGLAKEPQNLFLRSNLGVAQLRQGKLRQAEITLKRALTASPDDAFARSALGIVYYRGNKLDEAIEQLTKAIALDPKSPSAHNHLGIVAGRKGWPEAAEQEFKKAIALHPSYADAHFNLAVVYATNQPPSRQLADQHYRKATALGATPDPALERLIRDTGTAKAGN